MTRQLVPRVIMAKRVGNTLTDVEGNTLRIKLHPELNRLAIARPRAEFVKWLKDAAQAERFASLVASTVFIVSKRGGSRTLLTAPVEWWLLWSISRHDPLPVILLEYDDLTAAQERAHIHAGALRLLCYPLANRVRAQLGMHCGFFGLTKRGFATVIMGGSEANLHCHLNHVATTRLKPKAPAPSEPQAEAVIPGVENERVQPDQEPPPRPTESPESPPSPVNSPALTDLTADRLNTDAELEGPIGASAPPRGEPRCVAPARLAGPMGEGQGGLGQDDGLLRPGTDDQLNPAQSADNGVALSPPSEEQAKPALAPTEDDPAVDEDPGDRLQLVLLGFKSNRQEKVENCAPTSALPSRTDAGRRGSSGRHEQLPLFVVQR